VKGALFQSVSFKFEQSVSLVTGATAGIGRALASRLADRGGHVVAVGRRQDRLDQLVSETTGMTGRIVPFMGDVTKPDDRAGMIQAAQALGQGKIDLLVNNAGVGAIGNFAEADASRLRTIMEVNFFSVTELTRLSLPHLRQSSQGVICNVGSVLGHCAVPRKSEYCASKFALHGWTDSIRVELKRQGINVILVSPSTTRSEFFDSLIDTDPSATSSSFGSSSPEEVADATLWAIRRGRREVILTIGGKALVYADRLVPGLLRWFFK
jgi:short-subunit dehydrogenase